MTRSEKYQLVFKVSPLILTLASSSDISFLADFGITDFGITDLGIMDIGIMAIFGIMDFGILDFGILDFGRILDLG